MVVLKESENSTLTAKILKILSRSSTPGCKYPCIQVQWYYKKKDVDFKTIRMSEIDRQFIGDNEVFPTNHKDVVPFESILSKIQVFCFLY